MLLVLRYIMGSPEDFSLDDGQTNPVDKVFLQFIWRKAAFFGHLGYGSHIYAFLRKESPIWL